MELLLLIVLGVMTYLIVKRGVAHLTRTPVWILWLVLMTPALIWMAWGLFVGTETPIPLILMFGPFAICPFLYLWLIQKGKRELPTDDQKSTPTAELTSTVQTPKPKAPKLRPITEEEEKLLRNCFPWGTYYLQNLDYHPQAILCRGKLRSNPEVAYATIRENIEQKFGDRFLVVFQEGLPNQPFFALVPNPRAKNKNRDVKEPLNRPGLALALLFVTLFTTTVVGAEMTGLSVEQWQSNPNLLRQGLPYSLGLLAILGLHELSHYFAAVRYKIRTTLPYFIPMPFLPGTLGAFIQMRSPVPNRKALFDVAIAGPLGGFILTVPLLVWGLSLSETVPLSDESGLFNFESLDPRFSFLMAVSSKIALGSQLSSNVGIHLHPLAIAGYLGLIVTALNLMPVGQLDGGHIVHAMFGQRKAVAIGYIARLLVLLLGFMQQNFLIWALFLFFIPVADEPALNDITELDDGRDFLGLLAIALLVIVLVPVPGTVAQWLNL
ncbi:MAG: site-2 protease family protein [Cyanobacteriota bacterium]|nr:site-2 protease family protein [Cyanobacteriota bacterium]